MNDSKRTRKPELMTDPEGKAWWNRLSKQERDEAIRKASENLDRPASPADVWNIRKGGPFDIRDAEGAVMHGADRARGVDVPIGAKVQGAGNEGYVVAMTDQLCIFVDAEGTQIAEAWASIHVQARGPEARATTGGPVGSVHADPFYLMAADVDLLADRISARLDALARMDDKSLSEAIDGADPDIHRGMQAAVKELDALSTEFRQRWLKGELGKHNPHSEPFSEENGSQAA